MLRDVLQTALVLRSLQASGCQVQSAHLVPGRPLVTINPPPPRASMLFDTFGWTQPDRGGRIYHAMVNGVRVEWRERQRRTVRGGDR